MSESMMDIARKIDERLSKIERKFGMDKPKCSTWRGRKLATGSTYRFRLEYGRVWFNDYAVYIEIEDILRCAEHLIGEQI